MAVAAAVAAELRLELRVGRTLFATLAELAFRNMRKACAATETVVKYWAAKKKWLPFLYKDVTCYTIF